MTRMVRVIRCGECGKPKASHIEDPAYPGQLFCYKGGDPHFTFTTARTPEDPTDGVRTAPPLESSARYWQQVALELGAHLHGDVWIAACADAHAKVTADTAERTAPETPLAELLARYRTAWIGYAGAADEPWQNYWERKGAAAGAEIVCAFSRRAPEEIAAPTKWHCTRCDWSGEASTLSDAQQQHWEDNVACTKVADYSSVERVPATPIDEENL